MIYLLFGGTETSGVKGKSLAKFTNPGRQIALVTAFCTVRLIFEGPQNGSWFVTLLWPGILRCQLAILKHMCTPLTCPSGRVQAIWYSEFWPFFRDVTVSWPCRLQQDVQAAVGFLCVKPAVLNSTIKMIPAFWVYFRCFSFHWLNRS